MRTIHLGLFVLLVACGVEESGRFGGVLGAKGEQSDQQQRQQSDTYCGSEAYCGPGLACLDTSMGPRCADQWGGYRHEYPSGLLTDGFYIDAKLVVQHHNRQFFYVDLRSAPKEGPVNIWIRPEEATNISTDGFLTVAAGVVDEREQLMDAQLMHFYLGPDGSQQSMTATTVLDTRIGDVFQERIDGWIGSSLDQREVVAQPGWAWGPWKLFLLRDDRSSPRIKGVLLNFPCHDTCDEEGAFERFYDLVFKDMGAGND